MPGIKTLERFLADYLKKNEQRGILYGDKLGFGLYG
jgi:hypothetical protein